MKLSKEALEEFKKIYLQERGVALTDEEADRMGWELLELAAITIKSTNPNKK